MTANCFGMGQEKPYVENIFLLYYMQRHRLCKQCNDKHCQGPLPHGPRSCANVTPAENNIQKQNTPSSWTNFSGGKPYHHNEGCS